MDPSIIRIEIAVLMVAAAVFLLMWLQGSMTAASVGRMMRMTTRIGLDRRIIARGDRQTVSLMKDVRERCARCPNEDRCERWLAGEIKGGNAFCPNARVFDELTETG
jgi:hypothetical protein